MTNIHVSSLYCGRHHLLDPALRSLPRSRGPAVHAPRLPRAPSRYYSSHSNFTLLKGNCCIRLVGAHDIEIFFRVPPLIGKLPFSQRYDLSKEMMKMCVCSWHATTLWIQPWVAAHNICCTQRARICIRARNFSVRGTAAQSFHSTPCSFLICITARAIPPPPVIFLCHRPIFPLDHRSASVCTSFFDG